MKLSLRPTPFGAALLSAALVIGAGGIIRQELAALLWGAAFLGLGAVCLLGCLAGLFLAKGALSLHPQEPLPFDGLGSPAEQPLKEFWKIPVPRRLPPGIFLFAEILYRRGGRTLKGLGGVELKQRGAEILLPRPLRGEYRGAGRLLCRDGLGLFLGNVSLAGEGVLRIFPPTSTEAAVRSPSSLGGEGPAESRSPRRSEELLDVRKYHPGDDPRRVHWKLYAHLEELFLRLGEEIPPPSGEFPVYLDFSAPEIPITPHMELFLDKLLGRFALWGEAVLEKGGVLILSEKEGRQAVRFGPGEEKRFLEYLAGLAWRGESVSRGPAEYPRFFFLTTPLSTDWEIRLAELEGTGRRGGATVLVPGSAVFGADESLGSPLKAILYRGEGSSAALRKEAGLLDRRGRILLGRLEEKHPPGGILVL